MSDFKIDLKDVEDKDIAWILRRKSIEHDPWRHFRSSLFAFILGMIFVAALDYGDVWLCVGDCDIAKYGTEKTQKMKANN